ncbi:MAG: hypothetical protein GC200_04110 [Tepidisphaera sp.]|nr:hypothetical protein [Tepidisphaera sp.]
MAEPNPPAAPARETRGKTVIARELGGDLPCARCKYNLKGLSIRGVCPECALPVRATLLAVVDPRANELRPIRHPRLVAAGLLAWGLAGAGATACAWVLALLELTGHARPAGWLAAAPAAFALFSGVGAIALIRPHAMSDFGRGSRAALFGVLAYAPLAILLFLVHARIDPFASAAYGPREVSDPQRLLLRIGISVLIALVAVLLRPNARMLAARSFLMRTGRTDRQTLRALASVLVLCIAGDLVRLAAIQFEGGSAQLTDEVGQLLVLVGSVLFTVGLVGVCVDCVRLIGVILEPPLSLTDLLSTVEPGQDAPSP